MKTNLIDVFNERVYPAEITVENGRIARITPLNSPVEGFALPGFIDAHIHIESSMLLPTGFARMAVVHGTVATVSDPHEIGNVLGAEGVAFMLENAAKTPFKFFFGAPSCVPATAFETAGAAIGAADVAALLARPDIHYLAEMMNWPGVLAQDPAVMAKIAAAKAAGKPVDGHAPGLTGALAARYAAAGIGTDHECFTRQEAEDKLAAGMKILIREGSAAKNFGALIDLLHLHPHHMMFCSDDKHPDDLVLGHIDQLVRRALALGIPLFKVLRAACVNPVLHYGLPVGLLRQGDPADFIVVDSLERFEVSATYIDGQLVAEAGQSRLPHITETPVNNFSASRLSPSDFRIMGRTGRVRAIKVADGEIVTGSMEAQLPLHNGQILPDVSQDVLKLCVVNRYAAEAPALAFIHGFGLRHGALASSVAHDSHNIIAVGTDDESICAAVNMVVEAKGGCALHDGRSGEVLALPVAGLMSVEDGHTVAAGYAGVHARAKALGTRLTAPFMSLSFMALLVIPSLKLSDKGLFDADRFAFVPVELD